MGKPVKVAEVRYNEKLHIVQIKTNKKNHTLTKEGTVNNFLSRRNAYVNDGHSLPVANNMAAYDALDGNL